MIKSMTGYGRGSASDSHIQLDVEVKTVNHRYRNINIKMPRQLNALENDIRRYITQSFERGHMDVFINIQQLMGDKKLTLNLPLALQYHQALIQLKQEFSLSGEVSLDVVSQNSGLFEIKEVQEEEKEFWTLVEKSLQTALENLDVMRIKEGKTISQDILDRCEYLGNGIAELEPRLADLPNIIKDRLKEKLEQSFPQVQVNEERLLQEVVMYVSRSDTTEEVVRFKSHLQQFKEWLTGSNSQVGKKLDFLIQEMNRELTTLASKVSDGQIIQSVVLLKSEMEKIREQIQNIE